MTSNKSYRTIQINKKTIRLHRHAMECHLGRKLLKSELVHHKNGNMFDNRIKNLEILTVSQHTVNTKKSHLLVRDMNISILMTITKLKNYFVKKDYLQKRFQK